MSHDIEKKQRIITTPSIEERVDAATPDRKKLSRKQLFGLTAGGVALATAVGLGVSFGVHAETSQDNRVPGTSQPVGESMTPSPEASASKLPVSSYEALNQNGGPFSAEELSKLSPEQLTALFQIKASEFKTIKNGNMPTDPADVAKFGEEYTRILAQRIEAWENAGCTKTEWTPYKNQGKGVFATAMATKYNAPISMGVFGYENTPKSLESNLAKCNAMFMDNQTLYSKVDVVDGSAVSTSQSGKSINTTVLYHYTDNYDLRKTLGNNPAYAPEDITLRWNINGATVNANGVVVASDINAAGA